MTNRALGNLVVLVSLSAAVIACEQTPTSAALPNPNFNANGPPAASGPFVVRSQGGGIGVIWENSDAPFIYVEDVDDAFGCSDPTQAAPFTMQLLDRNAAGALHILTRAKFFTRLWFPATFDDLPDTFEEFCDSFVDGPLLFATGTSTFRSGWSNLGFPEFLPPGGPGATIFHLTSNGTLEDDAGKTYTVHIRRRFQLLPDGTFKVSLTVGPELSPNPFD